MIGQDLGLLGRWSNENKLLGEGIKKIKQFQVLNFALEGTQQFSSGKGHFYEANENLYWKFSKGTKAKGTTAIAVGVVGYFDACSFSVHIC